MRCAAAVMKCAMWLHGLCKPGGTLNHVARGDTTCRGLQFDSNPLRKSLLKEERGMKGMGYGGGE